MSDAIIQVRGLGKRYRIGEQRGKYKTIRESFTDLLRAPFRKSNGAQAAINGVPAGSAAAATAPAATPADDASTFWALKDVSFEVKRGEVLGIIGRNGAGKSTLLKVLSRITPPTEGEIEVVGRIGSLLEVGTGFHPELTGRENVYLNGAILGMTRGEINRKFDEIVAFAETEKFLDTPVKFYSSGMYTRLAFAVAAHLEPEILIVDEVLAVGDADFQKKCMGKMGEVAGQGRTVLFVSHNMGAMKELCTSCLFLAGGKVQSVGPVEEIIRAYLDQGAVDEIRVPRGPIQWARAYQDGETIVVEAAWRHTEPLALPSLGFVIYDYLGNPIVGSNPRLVGIGRADQARSEGRITARLTEPRLLDGQYYLSLWFGDGVQDFVELQKCISVEVRGMAGPRQSPPSIAGCAAPRCEYTFEGAARGQPV
jgi:lipopolysaccharide transport system ATP-binding protein